jgi:chemotaxis protein CheX
MNVSDLIVSSIRHAVADVFTTMLGVDIEPGEVTVEHAAPEANDGVVSFIGVAGTWTGTGSLSCSPALACQICSKMLLMESASVDEEVLDAVAELTNMIIGNVKSDLEQHLGPLGLSIPTVIFGRNFKTKSGGNGDWITERFRWDGEELLVKLCLAPAEKSNHPARPLGQTCPLEI